MRKLTGFLLALILIIPAYAASDDMVDVWVGRLHVDRLGASFTAGSEVYVPISDVSFALGAECVAFDECENAAEVFASGLRITAEVGSRYIEANGRYIYCQGGVIFRYNRVMVPANALCRAFGARMSFDRETGELHITEAGEPIHAATWTEDDIYWLSRIVNAEARGESFEGKIAVANVVLNRVKSDDFPGDIKSVIFDRRFGVQFTPTENGAIYSEPTEDSVLAAHLALDGANTAGESLYFASKAAAKYCWAEKNRAKFGEVDHQVFYL